MKTLSQNALRQRKFLTVLPVLVLPFIIMIFWSLGGGKTVQAQGMAIQAHGLELQLPDAQKDDDRQKDKLGFYQQAEQDSAAWRDRRRNDPYYHDSAVVTESDTGLHLGVYGNSTVTAGTISNYVDPNEAKVNQKLEQLYQQLNTAQNAPPVAAQSNYGSTGETERMAALMKSMSSGSGNDPEMQQLTGMLDKILYIEHPELARNKIREESIKNKKQAFTVSTGNRRSGIQLMEGTQQPVQDSYSLLFKKKNGKATRRQVTFDTHTQSSFYEWSDIKSREDSEGNAIQAVVAETRTLVAGATIKLKLLSDIYINGQLIPRDEFVYGTCSIANDRLMINLSAMRFHNSIYPVELSVYDMDGIAGVNVPDAVSRQVSKNSATHGINGVDVLPFDNTLKGQAINVGVQATKGLFSKKAQIVRVTVKEGYRVMLRNNNDL